MMKLAEYIADLFRPEVRRGEIRIRIRQEDRDEGNAIRLNIQCQLSGRVSPGAAKRAISLLIDDIAKAEGIPSDDFWVKCWQARKEGQEV